MIALNATQEKTLNKMLNKTTMLHVNLTEDDMAYYNAHYHEQDADFERMTDIADKLHQLMMADVESTDALRDVYTEDVRIVEDELNRTNATANLSGVRKMFNFKKRKRAKAKIASINDKRELVAAKNEFDEMYDKLHDNACGDYFINISTPQTPYIQHQRVGLERMIAKLGYDEHSKDEDYDTYEDEKLDYLRRDDSTRSKIVKMGLFSRQDRDYKSAASDFKFEHGSDIKTAWVKRDIVGYCCKMDSVDQNSATLLTHAKNLDKIVRNGNEDTQNMSVAVQKEVIYLNEQNDDLLRWKTEHNNLFAENIPTGREAMKNIIDMQRAIKKLQVSKEASKAILKSMHYSGVRKTARDKFEKETMVNIWAMDAYVAGLIALANSHYQVLCGQQPQMGEVLDWKSAFELAGKTDFAKEA